MLLLRSLFGSLICVFCLAGMQAQSITTYEEQDGVVAIEMESFAPINNWRDTTIIRGAIGGRYMEYTGPDRFNEPASRGYMRARMNITKTGDYRIQWRSRIAKGDSNTEHNDSWLRLNDASEYYAKKGNAVIYPKGSGQSPTPEGAGSGNWFKVYQNALGGWTWATRTSDNDPHEIYARFDSAGVYTIEISGRSNGHAIDRIVLYHSDVRQSSALSETRPESPSTTTNTTQPAVRRFHKLYPNPASTYVRVVDAQLAKLSGVTFELIDTQGRVLPVQQVVAQGEEWQIDIANLASGQYTLRARDASGLVVAAVPFGKH